MFKAGDLVIVVNEYDSDLADFYHSREVLRVEGRLGILVRVVSKRGRVEFAFSQNLKKVDKILNRR